MIDCSDELNFDPAPAPRRRPPPIRISAAIEGGLQGTTSASLILGDPPDPPALGLAEAVWSEFFLELVDILRDAWVALRSPPRGYVSELAISASGR